MSVAAPVSGLHPAPWDDRGGFYPFNGLMVTALAVRAAQREGRGAFAAGHEWVEDADLQERHSLLEAGGYRLVGCAGLKVPARMVVVNADGSGVVWQSSFGDFARLHFRAVDGAAKEIVCRDDAVADVQQHHADDLVVHVRAPGFQVVGARAGVADFAVALQATLEDLLSHIGAVRATGKPLPRQGLDNPGAWFRQVNP